MPHEGPRGRAFGDQELLGGGREQVTEEEASDSISQGGGAWPLSPASSSFLTCVLQLQMRGL